MKDEAEQVVARFYNDVGWKTTEGVTEDARLFEDLRACAREYVSKCRLRVLDHVPAGGDYLLDLGSGPIQYPEYLAYSRGFQKRYCVDLSEAALDQAREKVGVHGVYLLGSFFDMALGQDFFECASGSKFGRALLGWRKYRSRATEVGSPSQPGRNLCVLMWMGIP